MRRSVTALAVGLGLAGLPAPARAAIVVYTFEAPEFVLDEATSLRDRAPNVGDPTFRTTFTALSPVSMIPSSYRIRPAGPVPIFSGQILVQTNPGSMADDLVLTFNTPVLSLTVDFVLTSATGGRLELKTPAGATSAVAGDVGAPNPGGTLTFSSATPFTTAALRGFNQVNQPTRIAIDDLTLETAAVVPEPTSLALLGAGLVGLAARRRLRRA